MSSESAIDLLRQTLIHGMIVAAPWLIALFVTGFFVSTLQTMMQLQDATLSAVPKLVVAAIVTVWLLPWMLERCAEFTRDAVTQSGTLRKGSE